MPHPRAVLALALLLAVTGCSADDAGRSGPSSPATPTVTTSALPLPAVEPTGLDPIRTASRPAWTSDDLPRELRRIQHDVTVVGDLALVTGARTLVVDLRSGRTVWREPRRPIRLGRTVGRIDTSTDESTLVVTPDGARIVLPYDSSGCAYGCPAPAGSDLHRGAVAVDPRTGDVVWGVGLSRSTQADFVRPADRVGRLPVTIEGVSGTTVVVGVGVNTIFDFASADRRLPAYVVGLDPATGERRWARPDLLVESLTGDLVVTRVNDERAPDLVVLDARTGRELWRTDATVDMVSVSPRVVTVVDRLGLVSLVESRTGAPLAQQPPPGTESCARWVRGDLDVACLWDDPDGPDLPPRLLTLARGGVLGLSERIPDGPGPDWTPSTLQDGVVTVGDHVDLASDDDSAVVGAVDSGGRTLLASALDRQVVSVDERYVVLGDDAGGGGYARVQVLRRR